MRTCDTPPENDEEDEDIVPPDIEMCDVPIENDYPEMELFGDPVYEDLRAKREEEREYEDFLEEEFLKHLIDNIEDEEREWTSRNEEEKVDALLRA